MFCSKKCINGQTETFLQTLAILDGNYGKVKQLLTDPELSNKTIFDFDFSNPEDPLYKYHLLLAVNSLVIKPCLSESGSFYFRELAAKLCRDHVESKIGFDFISRLFEIKMQNLLVMDWHFASQTQEEPILKEIGKGLFAFGSLLNHVERIASIIPIANIDAQTVDNKFVYIVRLPILKGEELLISAG
jgi:hypothetical protein